METDDGAGWAVTSPDQFYEYDSDDIDVPTADNPSMMRNDALSGEFDLMEPSFSFSEDDLVPFADTWSDPGSAALRASGSIPHDNKWTYSQTQLERPEPKITLHRAYVLSGPTPPEPIRPPSPSERRSSRISRTFQSLRRKKKPDPTPPIESEHETKRSRLKTVVDNQRSRSRSFSRKGGTSRGRPKTEEASIDVSKPFAWYQRPRSVGRKRRQSRPDDSQSQPEDMPSQAGTMPAGLLDQAPSNSSYTSSESLPQLPQSPINTNIPEAFPIWGVLRPTAQTPVREPAQTPTTKEKRKSFRISGYSLRGETAPISATNNNGVMREDAPVVTKSRRKSLPSLPSSADAFAGGLNSNPAQDMTSFTVPLRRKSLRPQSRAKDELWPKFRSLESEYSRVADRAVGSKASSIDNSLLPFLRNHTTDATIDGIPLDFVERRCNVLRSWWTLVLDLIEGWDDENASYISRSNAMEAIIALTQRPEWRCVPETMPLQSRFPCDDEATAAPIADRIQEAFAQLLLRQTAAVVFRLSAKEGAGILTRAGGISCAYAFFFCPGVGEHLLRIWRTPSNIIRKVRESVAPETPLDMTVLADIFAMHFPKCVRGLRFASSRSTMTNLARKPPSLDLEIDWNNPHWLDKWSGKRTDLFFVFLKHYHLLLADFVPDDGTALQRISAPGTLLVQAQIVLVTRSALAKRQSASPSQPVPETPSTTFETLLNADSAAVVATPPPEAVRALAGRRMSTLVQEMLEREDSCSAHTRSLFAESSSNSLKATARQISLFDHGTCYNFCDLLEHVLPSLAKARSGDCRIEDAAFWKDVLLHMLKSDNTLTALRVFSLIYTIWPDVTADQTWKQQICHGLLLNEDVFNLHFNHWCPIVRVYFMRLLAWRVARCDHEPDGPDLRTLKTSFFRVQQCWGFYQYLRDQAMSSERLPPSTVPDNPIPSRRLLILRRETPPSTSHGSNPYPAGSKAKRMTSPPGTGESSFNYAQILAKVSSTLEEGLEQGRRRSGLLRSLSNYRFSDGFSSTARSDDVGGEHTSPSEPTSRASVWEQRRPASAGGQSTSRQRKSRTDNDGVPPYIPASFRFSLEAVEKESLPAMHLDPPRLPFNAQACLEAQASFVPDVPACKPPAAAVANAKYTGRALAEWNMTVNECTNFFQRRRMEGVPSYDLVETPSLGVENFRRPG